MGIGHQFMSLARYGHDPYPPGTTYIFHDKAHAAIEVELEDLSAVLRELQPPTAFAAWNDFGALKLFGLLTQLGIRVPQDVSLMGYDNLPESSLIYPKISTVDSSIEHQLQTALAILTSPQTPAPNHTVVALPSLIRRDSTSAR